MGDRVGLNVTVSNIQTRTRHGTCHVAVQSTCDGATCNTNLKVSFLFQCSENTDLYFVLILLLNQKYSDCMRLFLEKFRNFYKIVAFPFPGVRRGQRRGCFHQLRFLDFCQELVLISFDKPALHTCCSVQFNKASGEINEVENCDMNLVSLNKSRN